MCNLTFLPVQNAKVRVYNSLVPSKKFWRVCCIKPCNNGLEINFFWSRDILDFKKQSSFGSKVKINTEDFVRPNI